MQNYKLSLLFVSFLVSQQSLAGELFPFDPPRAKKSCNYTVHLDVSSEIKVANVAGDAKRLSPKEQKQFIKIISTRLKKAVIRDAAGNGLSPETLYYAELLEKIDP